MVLPRHLAIIMDGNGRWAKARGHNRFFGHIRGAKRAKQIIEESARLNLESLTLFTFSTENWMRPQEEVSFLMLLLKRRLKRETPTLIKNNIQFRCLGDMSELPVSVQKQVEETTDMTKGNTGLKLNFALNYGGRQEILQGVRKIARLAQDGDIEPSQISEEKLSQSLQSCFLPDPDLIIRTSGESRLSNFFLWQAAYSEFHVVDIHWPDFKIPHLHKALHTFASKERRFGKTSDQVKAKHEVNLQ